MKLEVGKKYRTVDGTIVTAKSHLRDRPRTYPFIIDNGGVEYSYTEEGFFINPGNRHELDIIEEIKETKMKLEVGKKYRTVDGTIVTVKAYEGDPVYPFRVAYNSDSLLYTEDGFYYRGKTHHELNIIEEIKENTMFNKDYKYLCMDEDGYNKAAFNRPTINTDMNCWIGYEDILQVGIFNLGDDWKDSLREIVYNADGSIYLRKPRHEFKVDDKVLVRDVGDSSWTRRHFCRYSEEGYIECYLSGYTSFTVNDTVIWDEIKPYEGEEV